MEKLFAECLEYGTGEARFVCNHLLSGIGLGVFAPDLEPGTTLTEAWCSDCEGVYLRYSSWCKESLDLANFRLVCEHCFPMMLKRNRGIWQMGHRASGA